MIILHYFALTLSLTLVMSAPQPASQYGNCAVQEECPLSFVCCTASADVAANKSTCRPIKECAQYPSYPSPPNSKSNQDCVADSSSSSFVKRCGNELYLQGKLFTFASFNVPGYLLTEDRAAAPTTFAGFPICRSPIISPTFDNNGYAYGKEGNLSCIAPKPADKMQTDPSYTWVPPTRQEQNRAALAIQAVAGKVLRTYTLGFGPSYHVTAPNSFNEDAWVAFDHALDAARTHGIKIMVPLLNNNFDAKQYGSYAQLAGFRGKSADKFYTDAELRQDVKDIITYMLGRRNSVNGIKYGDDDTFLAIELGNELGGWTEAPPPADWTIEMAGHIKKLAPNMLVADGSLPGLDLAGRVPRNVLQSSSIDIITNHYYNGKDDVDRVLADAKYVKSFQKVFLLGEIGFDSNVINDILKISATAYNQNSSASNAASGVFVWSLRYHSSDGGFYSHAESQKGVFSYITTPTSPSASSGLKVGDSKMLENIYRFSLQIQENVTLPLPAPCLPASGIVYSPRALRWVGSPFAASYQIKRAMSNSTNVGDASTVAVGVLDTQQFGSVLYDDSKAEKDIEYYYFILPVAGDGRINHENPLRIGPVKL